MTLPRRNDDELDRLLHAAEPGDRAILAEALRTLRADLDERPDPDVAERHLAAITAAAADAAHAPSAGSAAPARAPWRARLRRLAGLTAVKVALGVGAAAAATGTGLATTGNLPDPAQRVVADVAERIGIDLPRPDASPATTPEVAPRDEARPEDVPGRPDDTTPPVQRGRASELPGRTPDDRRGRPDAADDRDAPGPPSDVEAPGRDRRTEAPGHRRSDDEDAVGGSRLPDPADDHATERGGDDPEVTGRQDADAPDGRRIAPVPVPVSPSTGAEVPGRPDELVSHLPVLPEPPPLDRG